MLIKANIQARIPSKAAGRLTDALTDIIRPWSEGRDLRADQIRLQREEVLLRIVKTAKKRIEIEKKPIRSIPNKTLVPFLEKASLENARDRTMIDMWTNLLASAATSEQPNAPRYVSILSEINGKQARLLNRIILRGR